MKEIKVMLGEEALKTLRKTEEILREISDSLYFEKTHTNVPEIAEQLLEEVQQIDLAADICLDYSICGPTSQYRNVTITTVPEKEG